MVCVFVLVDMYGIVFVLVEMYGISECPNGQRMV